MRLKLICVMGVLLLLGVIGGCGGNSVLRMYEGELRDTSEIAVVDVGHRNIALMGVDSLQHTYQALGYSVVELLPGRHILTVHYSSKKGRSSQPLTLEFEGQGGERYVLKAVGGYTRWSAWVERVADSAIVAGHKPNW